MIWGQTKSLWVINLLMNTKWYIFFFLHNTFQRTEWTSAKCQTNWRFLSELLILLPAPWCQYYPCTWKGANSNEQCFFFSQTRCRFRPSLTTRSQPTIRTRHLGAYAENATQRHGYNDSSHCKISANLDGRSCICFSLSWSMQPEIHALMRYQWDTAAFDYTEQPNQKAND